MAGINKKEGNQHYDVACIWDETGTLLGEYKKIHLWDKENDFFAKGEELVTVSFKGWTIGLLICADFGFSELAKSLALKKNADVIMYPSAWNPGWDYLFSGCSSIRAAENQVYTVGLNRASGDVEYCGTELFRIRMEQRLLDYAHQKNPTHVLCSKRNVWRKRKKPSRGD